MSDGDQGRNVAPVDRLNELLAAPVPRLDKILAVIASVDPSGGPTEDEVVADFDRLAERSPQVESVGACLSLVFDTLGFAGDVTNYYDPANSLIHLVLARRRGIPITLGVVASEIARRHGHELVILGMPGHVLLGEGANSANRFDPFDRGRLLSLDECRALFARVYPIEAFRPSMLDPLTAEMVTSRVLLNLRVAFGRQGRITDSVPVLELRAGMASAELRDRVELANTLAAVGRFDRAADEYERLVSIDPERADAHLDAARALRAHRN